MSPNCVVIYFYKIFSIFRRGCIVAEKWQTRALPRRAELELSRARLWKGQGIVRHQTQVGKSLSFQLFASSPSQLRSGERFVQETQKNANRCDLQSHHTRTASYHHALYNCAQCFKLLSNPKTLTQL